MRTHAYQHDHHAGALRRKHEAACGIEVQHLRGAPDLADDGASGEALGGFDGGTQGRDGITRLDEEDSAGIKAKGVEAIGRELADLVQRLVVTGPYDGGACCSPQRQGRCEAACGGGIGLPLGHDLVQRCPFQSATDGSVDRAIVDRDETFRVVPGARRSWLGLFDFGQALPQRQDLLSCRGHDDG